MMIRLYPEQLRAQLKEGLRAAYLLLGNDPLLLQESLDAVRHEAASQGFDEHHTVQLDNNTDWNALFSLCQAMSFLRRARLFRSCCLRTALTRPSMNSWRRWSACFTAICC